MPPTIWVRMHYEQRESLFVRNDRNFEEQLGDGRMTLLVRPERDALWHCDEWPRAGVGESSEPFVGATCFEKATSLQRTGFGVSNTKASL